MAYKVNRVRKKILKLVKFESFSKELLEQIYTYLSMKDIEMKASANSLVLKSQDKKLRVQIQRNRVSYQIEKKDECILGSYRAYKSGFTITHEEKEELVYDLDEKNSHNVTDKKVFRLFDKRGVEQFRRETEKKDNFYEDKQTGCITLSEPDIFENYIQNEYLWRIDDTHVLKRKKRVYAYPDGTKAFIDLKNEDYCYIRYELLDTKGKEIPMSGRYFGVDKDIFFQYFQKKATMEDIIDNFHSKKYVIKSDFYI